MTWISLAGIAGLVVQFAVFFSVCGYIASNSAKSRALTYGAIAAVFGVPLLYSFAMFAQFAWWVVNSVLLVLLAFLYIFSKTRTQILTGLNAFIQSFRSWFLSATVISTLLVLLLIINYLKPDLSIDGQLYHGPILANMLQTGSLWGWQVTNQYFYYTDLTMAGGLNIASFSGVTYFDDAIQLPHLLLIIFGITWILQERFKSVFLRVSLAILIVASPVIWVQTKVLYVDLAYGAAVFTTVILLVELVATKKASVLLLSVAIAAVVATKPAGALTGLGLVVISLIILLIQQRKEIQIFFQNALIICAVSLTGFVFYIRNFVAFKNPFYPVTVEAAGLQFPGIIDLSVFTSGQRGNGLFDISRILSFFQSHQQGSVFGIQKLDYDPREGGFGFVPVIVLVLFVLFLLTQIMVGLIHQKSRLGYRSQNAQKQLLILLIVLVILGLQPSTFDSRYVIGPTISLIISVLLTEITFPESVFVLRLFGFVVFTAAMVQITWNEIYVYPGVSSVRDLRKLPSEWQPSTPGNIWGKSDDTLWLPRGHQTCSTIAIETNGGLISSGMNETSKFAALPYSLYGDELCNTVTPFTLKPSNRDLNKGIFNNSNFILIDSLNVQEWKDSYNEFSDCVVEKQRISGNDSWPESITVYENDCKIIH